MTNRTATIRRETSESSIELVLDLDGTGTADIDTSVPFYDHLLTAFAKHSLVDLTVRAKGDIEIDVHHTVEDIGIALGRAIARGARRQVGHLAVRRRARAARRGARAGRRRRLRAAPTSCTPASRPGSSTTSSAATSRARWCATSSRRSRSMPRMTVHVTVLGGRDPHHIAEAEFKAFARASASRWRATRGSTASRRPRVRS